MESEHITKNSFVSYTPDEIRLIGQYITELLDIETINSLKEIKENNLFIRRKSPVKLKYTLPESVAVQWRKEKEIGNQLNELDLFKEKLNSNLNKISNSNFEIIKNNIENLINTNNKSLEYQNACLEIIFDKSINESNFGKLYSRVCDFIIEIYGENFRNLIIDKCNDFYKNNIVRVFNSEQFKNVNYEELCNLNKEKSKLIGSFIFMGGLYNNSIINYDFIINYFNILIDSLFDKSNENDYEKYIECLVNFTENIGKKMEEELGEDFKTVVLDKLLEIKNNRSKFKPRSRFLIMDLIDLHSKNWEKSD